MSKNFNKKYLEASLFFKRWLKNPRRLGSIFPSSNALGTFITKQAKLDGDFAILELGAGTGSLTRDLLNYDVAPKRIYIVELDLELCGYLRDNFPHCHVIHGCATKLDTLLPKNIVGRIHTTISSLPLLNMPKIVRKDIMSSVFKVMTSSGAMLQYTYSLKASFMSEEYGINKDKLGIVLRNIPPATVWRYSRAQ